MADGAFSCDPVQAKLPYDEASQCRSKFLQRVSRLPFVDRTVTCTTGSYRELKETVPSIIRWMILSAEMTTLRLYEKMISTLHDLPLSLDYADKIACHGLDALENLGGKVYTASTVLRSTVERIKLSARRRRRSLEDLKSRLTDRWTRVALAHMPEIAIKVYGELREYRIVDMRKYQGELPISTEKVVADEVTKREQESRRNEDLNAEGSITVHVNCSTPDRDDGIAEAPSVGESEGFLDVAREANGDSGLEHSCEIETCGDAAPKKKSRNRRRRKKSTSQPEDLIS
ncbi:uncharacterized protein LOC100897386 [Galendromus occidentalis]|uniref:Uncharacterized protein LOC100897386 n=1 Tax=Galendromus occidentalis TaxID=34638 RepID=A0AAJ6VX34_9ACAR|nr:uncharacterized protein LOC100897386 [Galendromus occidentalis]